MFLWYSKRLLTDRQISGLKKHKYATGMVTHATFDHVYFSHGIMKLEY